MILLLGGRGRGFDSLLAPMNYFIKKKLAIAQLVEQWTVVPTVGCSNHPREKARLAQSVERQTFNLVVVGSSPTSGVSSVSSVG